MLYRYFIPGVKGGGKKAPKFITEARDIRENQDFLILAWQIALWSSVAHNGTFLASFCAITGILGLDIWNGRVFVAVFFSIKLQGVSVTVLELKLWLQISQSCSSRQWACPVMLQLHGLISTWLGSVCDIMVCWFNKTCYFWILLKVSVPWYVTWRNCALWDEAWETGGWWWAGAFPDCTNTSSTWKGFSSGASVKFKLIVFCYLKSPLWFQADTLNCNQLLYRFVVNAEIHWHRKTFSVSKVKSYLLTLSF